MTYTDLITRLEGGSGEDKRLDDEIWAALDAINPSDGPIGRYHPIKAPPDFTTSLDAVIALVGRVLPEANYISLVIQGGATLAKVGTLAGIILAPVSMAQARTAPRALVAALLRALEAREGRG